MVDVSCTNEMYCLANICYVCLEQKDKLLSNINSSLSVNKDLIHIIDYLPFNLAWLKTLQIILICDECCLRLRDTYQYMEKCLKNSALLQAYMDKLNATLISNTANQTELFVKLHITPKDIKEKQSEDDEIYTFQWQPNIEGIDVFVDFEDSLVKEGIIRKNKVDDKQEYPTDNNSTEITEEKEDVSMDFEDCLVSEGIVCKKEVDDMHDNNSTELFEKTEDVFVNLEDYFVKEENTWNREEVDNVDEYPTDNNSTENIDDESEINDNAHLTNADSVSSGFTCKQAHVTNKKDLNTAAKKLHKCSSCSKSFITKSELNIHRQIHGDKKSYDCTICPKRFSQKGKLSIHMRVHTGEKPYICTICKKCFSLQTNLTRHKRIHTGEKPHECSTCKKCFVDHSSLLRHMRLHSGEKPYECSICKKRFSDRTYLVHHIRVHTGEKPYECSKCKKRFAGRSQLVTHMKSHTCEKPHKCSKCRKCFAQRTYLVRHMRMHTGRKPYE